MSFDDECVDLSALKMRIITGISGMEKYSEEVIFTLSDGSVFKMYHEQDCCESVSLADVCGDIDDLIGSVIVHFEERTDSHEVDYGSETFTFYDIQTAKGCVNLRWVGESNGYYSESVDVVWVKKEQDIYAIPDSLSSDGGSGGSISFVDVNDAVKQPKHYMLLDTEAIILIARTMTIDEWRGYCRGNVLKYRLRAGKKDDVSQDLAKADFYEELFEMHKDKCIGVGECQH